MRNAMLKVCLTLVFVQTLGGCAAAAIAGAAAGTAGAASIAADRRTMGTVVEDEAIELRARNALTADRELAAQVHANVTSYNGRVLLTGEAPTDAQRQRVVELVRGVDKVRLVYNEMSVSSPSSMGSRSTDALLTTRVKAGLVADPGTTGFNVKVVTEGGVVYLMGLLSTDEGRRAADVAHGVDGVQKVVSLFEQSATGGEAPQKRGG